MSICNIIDLLRLMLTDSVNVGLVSVDVIVRSAKTYHGEILRIRHVKVKVYTIVGNLEPFGNKTNKCLFGWLH